MWLAEGDSNTAYFHNSMKDRYNTNKIVSLELEDGHKVYDMPQIHQASVSIFALFSRLRMLSQEAL